MLKTSIPFFKYSPAAIAVSMVFAVMTVSLWVGQGDAKFGLDFAGGEEVVVRFGKVVEEESLRHFLAAHGFGDSVIQSFGDELDSFSVRVRTGERSPESSDIQSALQAFDPAIRIESREVIGPVIGGEIRRQAQTATAFSLVGMWFYLAARFEWRYSVGATVALIHDVVLALGFALLAGYQLNMQIVAALMTTVGYSVNDTIVIFDRVRENLGLAFKASGGQTPSVGELRELMNSSINQTLSRTILTSLTTFMVVGALWLLGGPGLEDFAFTMLIGLIAGVYSTVFIACPVVLGLVRVDFGRMFGLRH